MVETKTPFGLRQRYETELRGALQAELGLSNTMQVPKLVKVVVNMGVGEAAQQSKALDGALADMELITGQKPIVTKAKTSISNFRLREGQAIGAKATLRGNRMYEFLDRLINIALPRVRDFRGLNKKSFDGKGNYAFGIKEHIIFPEINYESVTDIWGMDVVISTSANTDEEALILLKGFNFPFGN